MLDNCTYDKIKILQELSSLLWFIQKHAHKEVPVNDACHTIIQELEKDLGMWLHLKSRCVNRLKDHLGAFSTCTTNV